MQSEPPDYNRPDVLPDRSPHKMDPGRSTSCPHPWPTSRGSAPGVKGPADLEAGGSRDEGDGSDEKLGTDGTSVWTEGVDYT